MNITEKLWPSLSFEDFSKEHLAKQIPLWENSAEKILELLAEGNVGLVADTGTGKTIIAILILLVALEKTDHSVLFLAPKRTLCYQHQKLFSKVCGDKAIPIRKTKVITGRQAFMKRNWHDPEVRIIFATPHVLTADLKRGGVSLDDFSFIIFDEFHHTVGSNPYVKIAAEAVKKNIRILGLSASPGSSRTKINIVKKNCFIRYFERFEMPMPPKKEKVVTVKPTEEFLEINEKFRELLKRAAKRLRECGFEKVPVEPIIYNNVLDGIDKELKRYMVFTPEQAEAKKALARYRKLRHAYEVLVSESYETFLGYTESLHKDNTKAAQEIIIHRDFVKIISLIKNDQNNHPKVLKFLELAQEYSNEGKRAIIFVAQKDTGRYLLEQLSLFNIRAEVVFGGKDFNQNRQEEVFDRLIRGELDAVIATSVIEEGVSIPEVDVIVNYSIPKRGLSRIQRSGRTARFKAGEVVYLPLINEMDTSFFKKSLKGEKKTKELVNNMKAIQGTLPLFPAFDEKVKPRRE